MKGLSSWKFTPKGEMDKNQVNVSMWVELHTPKSSHIGVLIPSALELTIFGVRAFKEVIHLK